MSQLRISLKDGILEIIKTINITVLVVDNTKMPLIIKKYKAVADIIKKLNL